MVLNADLAPSDPQPQVALLAKPGNSQTGVGRYVKMLSGGLAAAGVDAALVAPSLPPLPNWLYRFSARLGVDGAAFLRTYPLWARWPQADVYHLTSQNLASLLLLRRPPGRVIVTVHDIIPYLLRDDPLLSSYAGRADRLFDRLAMAGLGRADLLVADSAYTRQTVIDQLGIPAERIAVVPLGIDHERFRPLAIPADIYGRYGLTPAVRYLIYVGSEDPRKNLGLLLEALAVVRATHPDVALIKVGRAHYAAERQRLVRQTERLGLSAAIHFLDDVAEADLPLLYNLASVCVMPSLYEGFGFPVLEAMACGTPVVYAQRTSLPELAGDAGAPFNPAALESLVASLRSMLESPGCQAALRAGGLARAQQFTWDATVRAMLALYEAA